jgi:choline dehydrogenase-like flavoprotein
MFYADLNPANGLAVTGNPADDAQVTVLASPPPATVLAEADQLAHDLLTGLGAQPVLNEAGLGLQTAKLGGVAHEVGTLRAAGDGTGVVDQNLKFLAYKNLYACDNSVFPASPAANPSLTTAALALRLARHLTQP